MTGPVAVTATAIVSSSFAPATNSWTVQLKTLTKRPYKLTSPTISSISGEIYTDNRYIDITTVTGISDCINNDNSCVQTTTLHFRGCEALQGAIIVNTIPVTIETKVMFIL